MTNPSLRQPRLFKSVPPAPPTRSSDRPSIAMAVLALIAVLSLGAVGALLNVRQEASLLTAQAEAARIRYEQDARIVREELAKERSAKEAAERASREAVALRETAQRFAKEALAQSDATERAANDLRLELAEERKRSEAAARSALAEMQRLHQAIQTAQSAATEAELQLALERAANKMAMQTAAAEAEAQATVARKTVEDTQRDLVVVMEFLVQERQSKDDAERALRASRQELTKALNVKSDFAQGGRRKPASAQTQARSRAALSAGALNGASPQATTSTAPSRQESNRGPGWATYRDAQFDFSLRYPTDVFLPGSAADQERAFVSQDGKARLIVHAGRNGTRKSIQVYRKAMLSGVYHGVKLDYAPVRKRWFVLSGPKGDEMLYDRITFTCGGQAVHGWRLVYPLAERERYDAIVEQMHKGYQFARRGGGCG